MSLLDPPLEHWLTANGDHRQLLDPETGLTRYRTSNAPRPGIPLGSCTASWPSERGFAMGQSVLQRMRGLPDGHQAVEGECRRLRPRLRRVFEMDEGPAMVLAPSGTDAIYMVSAVLLARPGIDSVHHIVVGASELGSGTVRASRGLTFSTHTPFGGEVAVGHPVAGLAPRCTAEPAYLREEDGDEVTLEQIDAQVGARAREVVAQGRAVLVHLVAHSKTGLRAPSLQAMVALKQELGERFHVMVDAAQGRINPADLRLALAQDFMVLWTGSKFYGGPPFSGLLVLPPALAADPGPLPPGMAAWFSRADLPAHWSSARASLPTESNPGLLLRWILALAEMEAYHEVPVVRRSRVYHTFAGAVVECFGATPVLRLNLQRPPGHRLAGGLGAYPSVFSFAVLGPQGRLDSQQLRKLYVDLDRDLSERDPRLRTRFHLGQPVSLGPPDVDNASVLRVALGARLVTEHHAEPDAGAAWFRHRFTELRTQIELLVEGV